MDRASRGVIVEPGGVSLSLGPVSALSLPELRFLDTLPARPSADDEAGAFRLALSALPWIDAPGPRPPEPGAATVTFGETSLTVSHEGYTVELDFLARQGRLRRREGGADALAITLRMAMTALLPFVDGLPIHGAGMVVGGRSLVFFGPSEAGKTTVSRASPWPVVSDEMVAVSGSPACLRATGYLRWPGSEPELPAPLAAMIELAKGPDTRFERLARPEALRRLLNCLWVPPVAMLQRAAMSVAARLVSAVPVYRMEWNPARPPFEAIELQVLGG